MSSLPNIIDSEYGEDIKAVDDWCEEIYTAKFSSCFAEVRNLYKKLSSKTHPITDDELEWVLTAFPLELFTISEELQKLKLKQEVVKLKNKEKRTEILKTFEDSKLTATAKKDQADLQMVEYDILLTALNSVISRVENELTFSREFIMGSKKIWDARKRTETVNPIQEMNPSIPDLPNYTMSDKTYIR